MHTIIRKPIHTATSIDTVTLDLPYPNTLLSTEATKELTDLLDLAAQSTHDQKWKQIEDLMSLGYSTKPQLQTQQQ